LDAPWPRPLPNLVLKVVLATYFSKPSSAPNLKLPNSTVAEISRSQIFLDAPLAKTPASFGPKSFFLDKLHPKPKLYTKFEANGSMVAEININIL